MRSPGAVVKQASSRECPGKSNCGFYLYKDVTCLPFLSNQAGLPSDSGEHTEVPEVANQLGLVLLQPQTADMRELPQIVLLLVFLFPSLASPFFLNSLLSRLFPSGQYRRAARSLLQDQLSPPPPSLPESSDGGFVTLHRPSPSYSSRPGYNPRPQSLQDSSNGGFVTLYHPSPNYNNHPSDDYRAPLAPPLPSQANGGFVTLHQPGPGSGYNSPISDGYGAPLAPPEDIGGFVTLHRPAPGSGYNSGTGQMSRDPPQCPPCPPCPQCPQWGGGGDQYHGGVGDDYGPPQSNLPQDSYGPPQDTQYNYNQPQDTNGSPYHNTYDSHGQNFRYTVVSRPRENPQENIYQPPSDGYGAPVAPPVTAHPCHHHHDGYNQAGHHNDRYRAQSGPCRKPLYVPQPYPTPPPHTTSRPEFTSYQPPFITTTTSTPAPTCLEVFTSTKFSLTSTRGLRPSSSCNYVIVPGTDVSSILTI